MIDIIGNIVISNEIRQKYFDTSLFSLCNISECINNVNITIDSQNPHGIEMLSAIKKAHSNYFLNFEEDHFCVCNDNKLFTSLITTCQQYDVDIIRASFFSIENQCAACINDIIFENNIVKIFKMHPQNFIDFQQPYIRYYIGTNSIFKTNFAEKLFNQSGIRPHDFEVGPYTHHFEYICAVPKIEILRAIDDDHGAENTCMLKIPTPQFLNLMK